MTKKILTLLLMILIFQGCKKQTSDKANVNVQLEIKATEIKSSIKLDSAKRVEIFSTNICYCDWEEEKFNHYTDLIFSNNGQPFNLDSLTKWIDDSERFNIKSLRLRDFDTIPSEMSIFENVESIYIEAINNKNVQGLEIFPKLRVLKAEEERFEINKETKWIEKIEVIHANKTKFSGITSFSQTPNLKEIKLNFSGFDSFPSDFEKMKCLAYFQTGAHTFCEIDLAQLDFTEMQCLEYIEFHSWRKNIKGTPIGMNNIKTVKISHPNLTQKEKQKLKKIGG